MEQEGSLSDCITLEDSLAIADRSVSDTVSMFFRCPFGFHGDSGLQHYLYHRIMTNGGERLIWPPEASAGKRTLLVQSEQYTTLSYRRKGRKSGPGRFDIAFVAPGHVRGGGAGAGAAACRTVVALEVGRNKAKDSMGDVDAPADAPGPRPGDAAKLVREIRYADLRVGYALGFYDSERYRGRAVGLALSLRQQCDKLGGERLRVALALFRSGADPQVWAYPAGWAERLSLPFDLLDVSRPPRGVERIREGPLTYEDFCDRCSPGGRALQSAIRDHFRGRLKLVYGPKTMTVNDGTGRLLRISNRIHPEGERIFDFDIRPDIEAELHQRVPHLSEGHSIKIPDTEDSSLTNAVVEVLQSL